MLNPHCPRDVYPKESSHPMLGNTPFGIGIRSIRSSLIPRVIRTVIEDSRGKRWALNAPFICYPGRERYGNPWAAGPKGRRTNKRDIKPGNPKEMGCGLLTCQLVSGRPETRMRNMVRRGRGIEGRSMGPEKFSLRRGPRANCTVSRSPLKSLPSVLRLMGWLRGLRRLAQ